MDNKKNQNTNEPKNKSKKFWKNVGFIGIALVLAIITVFVLNLNM